MKYGILTYHNIPNIGAILQAQALCEFIRSRGFDCDIVDYTCDNIVKRELEFHPLSNPLRNCLSKYYWRKTEKKIERCNKYIRSLHLLSARKYNRNTISEANKVYDAFISGSDMIWNLNVNGNDYSYFLDFAKSDKIKLAFASSIGAKWTDEELQKVLPLLKIYHSISVREKSTNEDIKALGISSSHLCDPTLLIEPAKWKSIAKPFPIKKYVLVYFPTKELIKKAEQYAKSHSLAVVIISQGIPTFGVKKVWPKDPPEWLGLFLNADAVFTNSFHGILFSFYFEKQVWTANYGNRITSILESLNLPNCRLDIDKNLTNPIDYKHCRERLFQIREKSQEYIVKTLAQIKVKK